MTIDEKITMVHGGGGPYVGNIAAIPRLGIPAIKMNDGPQGFRGGAGTSTQWPSCITVAASFDPTLFYEWGVAMGKEFAGKGANVQLGPGVNVARVPVNGRNFEYLSGEDPFLGSANVRQIVKGIQGQGVIANAKHYIHNNQEANRGSVSANVDERTRMEIYMPPFAAASEAGLLSVMCSYNKINSTYSCENDETLTKELKGYVGFSGWVMSDWGATHSTDASAIGGLDQQMPDQSFFGANLKADVQAGKVPEARLDDMVLRILTALYAIGEFDHPVKGNINADVTSPENNRLARTLAAQSIVLLKNDNNLLPLPKTVKNVAVFNAPASTRLITGGGGSGSVAPKYQISPLAGINNALNGHGANVQYYGGTDTNAAVSLAQKSDVSICVLATSSSEGGDRRNLDLPPEQVAVCQAVGKVSKTVAVVITPGAALTNWASNVNSLLVAFMPGQEEGNAIADVLFGDVNPGGKLPVTFPNVENEVGFKPDEYPGVNLQEYYREQLNVGYRWYATHSVKPRYAFGFGLSYTNFTLSDLTISGKTVSAVLKNTGMRAGSEVVQLYLGFPASAGEPPIQLKGFQKQLLDPGKSETISFTLSNRDLSIWDVRSHSWQYVTGEYTVHVGTSSQDLTLKQTTNF